MKLSFGPANAKLEALEKLTGRKVFTFSLLSGHTCPYAKDCLSMAVTDPTSGKRHIEDGKDTKHRCFSASQEVLWDNLFSSREKNGAILPIAAKNVADAAAILSDNLPTKSGIIRVHVGGDFQTKNYFQAWLMTAAANPSKLFYAYTKSLPFWVWAKSEKIIPKNFVLTASYGGHKDSLIKSDRLRYSKVVFSEAEAKRLKLEIDHDDSHAALPELARKSFALLLHGTQPKGSEAVKALKKLNGVGTYGRGTK